MKSYHVAAGVSLTAICLVLAACGKSDVDSTPDPTPTPTTSPTPTATPTYLTMAQVNATGGDKYYNPAGVKWQTLGPATGATAFLPSNVITFEYLATGNTYRVTRAVPTPSPTPSPLPSPIAVEFPAGSGTTIGQTTTFVKTNGTATDTLKLITPRQAGIDLTYTRFLAFDHDDTGTADDLHYRTAYGVLTYVGDVPRTGTASYFTTVLGTATRGGTDYVLDGDSTGTFSVNFAGAADQVTTTLNLNGRQDSASPAVSFGTLNGTGSIAGIGFAGNLTATAGGSGQFGGAFFGPQAAEYGYSWLFSGTDFTAEGFAGGKKNP